MSLLTKIPADKQKSIAGGLLFVAAIATPWVLIGLLAFSEKTEEKCTGLLWARECVETEIPLSDRLVWLLIAVGSVLIALVSVFAALRLTTMQGHLKRYLAILTGVEAISIQQVAEITHSRPAKVRSEIQTMIDSDMITDFYIDYGSEQIVSKKYIPKTSHKTVVKCSECGGNNDLIVGITKYCNFCGQPLLLGTPQGNLDD